MSDEMQSPLSDKPLSAKMFSLDMMIWMAITIFTFGVGYAALANGTDSNAKSIDEIRTDQKEVVKDISQIKISISRIGATQSAIATRIQSQQTTIDNRMRRQESDIRDILTILRKERNGNGH